MPSQMSNFPCVPIVVDIPTLYSYRLDVWCASLTVCMYVCSRKCALRLQIKLLAAAPSDYLSIYLGTFSTPRPPVDAKLGPARFMRVSDPLGRESGHSVLD